MRLQDLPGPRGLPIFGNALQLERPRMHLIAERWSRAYGDYFRFRIGPREILAVANPETIAAMLRDRPDGFSRTTRLSAIANDMGFSGLFSAEGDAWRRQRPMVMASFDPGHIKSYFRALVKVTVIAWTDRRRVAVRPARAVRARRAAPRSRLAR